MMRMPSSQYLFVMIVGALASPTILSLWFGGIPPGALPRDPRLVARQTATDAPLFFESNSGRYPQEVLYVARLRDGMLYFQRDGVVIRRGTDAEPAGEASGPPEASRARVRSRKRGFEEEGEARSRRSRILRTQFVGGNAGVLVEGRGLRGEQIRWYGGSAGPEGAEVCRYDTLVYRDLYPGIDLVYRGTRTGLKYEYVVRPGSDAGRIRLRYTGQDSVTVTEGTLTRWVWGRAEREEAPLVLQGGSVRPVVEGSGYRLYRPHGESGDGGSSVEVGFDLGAVDPRAPLLIDPLVSTYLGGSREEGIVGMASREDGTLVLVALTNSADFPLPADTGAQEYSSNDDIVVMTLSGDGSRLLRGTYFGGSGEDRFGGLSLDDSGNLVVGGQTDSPDLPTFDKAYQKRNRGNYDGYVAVFDTACHLRWCTYLGGFGYDDLLGVAVDGKGRVYATGLTDSRKDFPLRWAMQMWYGGGEDDVFITCLKPDGTGLEYSTYLGGEDFDEGYGITVDEECRAVVVGMTASRSYPVTSDASQRERGDRSFPITSGEGFVARLSSNGRVLEYSTFLGGLDMDEIDHVRRTEDGFVVAGRTCAGDFPTTAGVVQARIHLPSLGTINPYVFLTRYTGDPPRVRWSTYLADAESGLTSLEYLPTGHVAVCGYDGGISPLPVTPNAARRPPPGEEWDGYVVIVDAEARGYAYCSYWGGEDYDWIACMAMSRDLLVLAGGTYSINLETSPGSFQPSFAGGKTDGYLTMDRLTDLLLPVSVREPEALVPVRVEVYPNPSTGTGVRVQVENAGQGPLLVRVFDVSGRTLGAHVVSGNAVGSRTLWLETVRLPKGVVYLQVCFADGRTLTRTLMVR